MKSLSINSQRLQERLNTLSEIGRLQPKGVCRLTLDEKDVEARKLLSTWMTELGLEIRVDEIGNMFGIYQGEKGNYVGTGSHLDTVPTGGYYDGALGVLAGLEVIETIIEHDVELPFSLVLTNFTNEEGVRFTPDMMGSLVYANPEKLEECWSNSDKNGVTVKEALKSSGYLGEMKLGDISFNHFIEVHIEQGPILEAERIDIGAVDRVQGIHWIKLIAIGQNAHAGTTPTPMRKDPFYALGALSTFCRSLCEELEELKVTIGSVDVFPNAINIIPQRIEATLDIRHPDQASFDHAVQRIYAFIEEDVSFKDLESSIEELVHIDPIKFDESLVKWIIEAGSDLGYRSKRMYSGAGHDAQLLASKYPSAMIFIPSENGISHAIEEYSSPEDITKGANVLLHTILNLS